MIARCRRSEACGTARSRLARASSCSPSPGSRSEAHPRGRERLQRTSCATACYVDNSSPRDAPRDLRLCGRSSARRNRRGPPSFLSNIRQEHFRPNFEQVQLCVGLRSAVFDKLRPRACRGELTAEARPGTTWTEGLTAFGRAPVARRCPTSSRSFFIPASVIKRHTQKPVPLCPLSENTHVLARVLRAAKPVRRPHH